MATGVTYIVATIAGEQHVGRYTVHRGVLTVTLGEGESVAAAVGDAPLEVLARSMLQDLVERYRMRHHMAR